MQAETIICSSPGYIEDMPTGRPAKQNRSPFGKRLNKARLAAGLSQVQLAEQLGITQSAYAAWEREHIALKPAQIAKLCSVLKVRVEELFEDRPTKRSGGPTGKIFRPGVHQWPTEIPLGTFVSPSMELERRPCTTDVMAVGFGH